MAHLGRTVVVVDPWKRLRQKALRLRQALCSHGHDEAYVASKIVEITENGQIVSLAIDLFHGERCGAWNVLETEILGPCEVWGDLIRDES